MKNQTAHNRKEVSNLVLKAESLAPPDVTNRVASEELLIRLPAIVRGKGGGPSVDPDHRPDSLLGV